MSLDQRSTIISEYRSKALVQEWFWHGTKHESVRLRLDSVERIIGGLFLFYVWTVQLGWDNIFRERQKAIFLAEWPAVGHLMGFLPGEWMISGDWDGSQLQKGSHSSAGALIRGWGSTWSGEDTRSLFPWLVRAEKEMVDACIGPSHAFSLGLRGHIYACHVVAHKNQQHTVDEKRKMCRQSGWSHED